MDQKLPAYSSQFASETLPALLPTMPLGGITADWAWGGATGAGICVAVIDSGIDASHEAIGGRVSRFVQIREEPEGLVYETGSHGDSCGHGTACASIIRALAPDCELYSVKVLGHGGSGRAAVFAAGLRWAIENGAQVCNLSLGTTRRDHYAVFHELADLAYFRNVALVAAANNMPTAELPVSLCLRVVRGLPRRRRPTSLLREPEPAGRIRRPRNQCARGMAGRGLENRHRQQLRRPPCFGVSRESSQQASRSDSAAGEGHTVGLGGQHEALMAGDRRGPHVSVVTRHSMTGRRLAACEPQHPFARRSYASFPRK